MSWLWDILHTIAAILAALGAWTLATVLRVARQSKRKGIKQ